MDNNYEVLWAKKDDQDYSLKWLPLFVHLEDMARVMELLWDQWASDALRQMIMDNSFIEELPLSDFPKSEEKTKALLRFLGASHDLGKATPVFQFKGYDSPLRSAIRESLEEAGLLAEGQSLADFTSKERSPHALAGEQLLLEAGIHENIACIVGAHHGKPSTGSLLENSEIDFYPKNYYGSRKIKGQVEKWKLVQNKLMERAFRIAEVEDSDDLPLPNQVAQVALAGLLIMADWIASNETFFPYRSWGESWADLQKPDVSRRRARKGYNALNLPLPGQAQASALEDLYSMRFGDGQHNFDPYPMQAKALEIAESIKNPGVFIIEAGMGQGKTEAALAAAEVFATKNGASGVFFALPTQATSNGIFPRIEQWLERLSSEAFLPQSIHLVHGKAQFNEYYRSLQKEQGALLPKASDIYEDEDQADSWVSVHSWFNGSKKGLLDHFVVGTIDQLLLAALKQKHFMLRQLGLTNKIVIIDEAHAFDAYMNTYLNRALEWLGAYEIPVIVLSATLPKETRDSFAMAYLRGRGQTQELIPQEQISDQAYPRFTYTDGPDLHQAEAEDRTREKTVFVGKVGEKDLSTLLADCLSEGGCAGIIVNTVKKAQTLYEDLKNLYPEEELMLLHSHYLPGDRQAKELDLVRVLGKKAGADRPYRRIIIGTQVFEQSLDIDFDLMITELCPMDLLLQRLGRLQRFDLVRPDKLKEAACYILHPEEGSWSKGSEHIYGGYLLSKTQALLSEIIRLPQDIPPLVQETYDGSTIDDSDDILKTYFDHYSSMIEGKESRANTYCLRAPDKDLDQTILDMTEAAIDLSQAGAEAKVRDTDPSLEVLAARVDDKGNIYFQDQGKDYHLFYGKEPDGEEARALARQQLRLPRALCLDYGTKGKSVLDRTIAELEDLTRRDYSWLQTSPWLKGELFLPFDESGHALLNGYELIYDKQLGLRYQKEEEDGGEGI